MRKNINKTPVRNWKLDNLASIKAGRRSQRRSQRRKRGKAMIIRQATREDAAAIAEIYNEAVINTVAIWNDDTVSAENRIAWMEAHWDKDYPVFVATLDDEVAGYATLTGFGTQWKTPSTCIRTFRAGALAGRSYK